MAEQPVIVQKISWSDLCPWTVIFKTLPVAASVSVLAFALLGVVLMPMGWLLSESFFVTQEMRENPIFMEIVEVNRSPYRAVFEERQTQTDSIKFLGAPLSGPRMVFQQFVRPFNFLFDGNWGLGGFLYFLLGCTWSILVWSFIGVAITRICLLRLTRNEQSGLDDAFEFAFDKWRSAAGAVGIPLLAIGVICIPTFIIGLLMSFDIGVVLISIIWFVVLAFSLIIGLLLLGLMFGWPLMISSVGCESQNSFDAMTRAYAYTFQKPLNYLFYSLIAILFGGFCWLIVSSLTDSVVNMSYWTTSWGTNVVSADRVDLIRGDIVPPIAEGQEPKAWTTLKVGQNIIGLWEALFKTLAAAFIYGLFWCMASAVYLLLRKDVDETEMDEISVMDEKRTYELPPLKSDENGIPQVQTPVPVSEKRDDSDPDLIDDLDESSESEN
ncbi:MAG: hypothetical protein AB8B55_18835 [Mariniblastus sp.]